jgi:hypothetical protein
MTSTHPPVWWKGPLGPLTSGRDLYGDLHETICRVVRPDGEQEDVHAPVRFALRVPRGPGDQLWLRPNDLAPLGPARHERRHDVHESWRH